jgi:hypothetical protein
VLLGEVPEGTFSSRAFRTDRVYTRLEASNARLTGNGDVTDSERGFLSVLTKVATQGAGSSGFEASGLLIQKSADCSVKRCGLFDPREVAALIDKNQLRVCNRFMDLDSNRLRHWIFPESLRRPEL